MFSIAFQLVVLQPFYRPKVAFVWSGPDNGHYLKKGIDHLS